MTFSLKPTNDCPVLISHFVVVVVIVVVVVFFFAFLLQAVGHAVSR